MHPGDTLQLGELCRRLDVPYRQARYVLEEGILPEGVDPDPDRGHHRQLTPAQAFWLGIVLKLKQSAVRTPLAAKVADFAREAIRGIAGNENWERCFSPFNGRLHTEGLWFVDVGDLRYIRVATDRHPSHRGRRGPYEFPWRHLDRHELAKDAAPAVVIRVDISRIARLIGDETPD